MQRIVITAVGAIASAIIKLIGISWELRAFAAVPTFSLMLFAAGIAYSLQDPVDTTAAPSISVISWGERDATHIDDVTGARGPGHILYATVELTAGSAAINIPDIYHPDPTNQFWLKLPTSTRQAPGARTFIGPDEVTYSWLPSHQARLVPSSDTTASPYPIPDAACASLAPQRTCRITMAWEFLDYGPIGPPQALALETTAHDEVEITWPTLSSEPLCGGAMTIFCGNDPNT
ncbi:hypothetical protein AU196_12635 [Mycobacterium sp. IS-1742]|uniref:hypothetical protein n=1 Tax=Mycobacterium sp. IS-1742 TaxID=1772285 RepID=UPI0007404C72|nr:hypothetical protein [Mycobacterium sp. IS-1742]KUI33138.1 hypothetical protein AU196_12635 [Mycobacterium sp. IS-1742]